MLSVLVLVATFCTDGAHSARRSHQEWRPLRNPHVLASRVFCPTTARHHFTARPISLAPPKAVSPVANAEQPSVRIPYLSGPQHSSFVRPRFDFAILVALADMLR